MLTCNAFADNTVGSTQQTAACKAPHLANLSDHELLPEQFMLLVLDSLRRLGLNDIEGVAACDFADALRNASCAMLTNTPAFSLEPVQLQAQILFLLNESLCEGCIAPTLLSAEINGSTVTLVFDVAVTGTAAGFELNADSGTLTPTYTSGSGTTTLIFTTNAPALFGDAVGLNYDNGVGNISSGPDCFLGFLDGFSVTNNTPP